MMPYNNNDLLTALQKDDLASVQKIIADYQLNPSDPKVLFGGGMTHHSNALFFALAHARNHQGHSVEIVQALLAINPPVFDLNAINRDPFRTPKNYHETLTVLFYVLNFNVASNLRAQLLRVLLAATGSRGKLNLLAGCGTSAPSASFSYSYSALCEAVTLDDLDCVQQLLSVRKPDGTAVLNVNQPIIPRCMLLDMAMKRASPAMVKAIQLAGGMTNQEYQHRQARHAFKTNRRYAAELKSVELLSEEEPERLTALVYFNAEICQLTEKLRSTPDQGLAALMQTKAEFESLENLMRFLKGRVEIVPLALTTAINAAYRAYAASDVNVADIMQRLKETAIALASASAPSLAIQTVPTALLAVAPVNVAPCQPTPTMGSCNALPLPGAATEMTTYVPRVTETNCHSQH